MIKAIAVGLVTMFVITSIVTSIAYLIESLPMILATFYLVQTASSISLFYLVGKKVLERFA
jgi:hypothetical protein